MNRFSKQAAGLVCAFAACTAFADDGSAGKFTFGAGADYSTGKYGGTQSTDVSYYSVSGRYEIDRWTAKLTLPWMRITGPGTVVGGDRPIVLDGNGSPTRVSVSGFGDVVGALTYTVVEASNLMIDVTGKVKFPTASETDGLGTGKTDYTGQVDAYWTVASGFTLFGGVGYRKFGDPAGVDFRNVKSANAGFTWKAADTLTAGMSFDYREAVFAGRDSMREVTPFVVWKFAPTTKIQIYAVHGYSRSSVDWGGGVVLLQSF